MRYIAALAVALTLAVVGAPASQSGIPLLSGGFNIPEEWWTAPNNDGAYTPWWLDEWSVDGEIEISPCYEEQVCGDHGYGGTTIGGPVVVVIFSYSFPDDTGGLVVATTEDFCAVNADEWNYDYCLQDPWPYMA